MRKSALFLLALTPLASSCGVLGPSEEHATLDRAPDTPEIPRSLSSVGWNWTTPEGTEIEHVSPTQHGVSVAVSDGVISLAGDTGDELWHYRRPDETITSAATTPDGTKVLVTYAGDHTDEEDEELPPSENEAVLLDATTGEIINQHRTEFGGLPKEGLDSNVYRGIDREPGIITDDARVIQESEGGTYGDVVALSLDDGEEIWRISPEQEDEARSADFVLDQGVYSQDTLIITTLFASENDEDSPSQESQINYTVATIGVDARDGSEKWRQEMSAEGQDDLPIMESGVSHEGSLYFATNTFDDSSEEWILDTDTGDPATEEELLTADRREAIGSVDDHVITERAPDDEETVEFSYKDLSGEVVDRFVTDATPTRRVNNTFIVPLTDAVAWLDVNQVGDYSWEPAQLVVTDRKSGDTDTLDLGELVVRESTSHDGTALHSVFPDPDSMTLAPGSLVITGDPEGEGKTRQLVGIVP